MGLLSGLAGLPFAPLKGMMAMAKHIQQQAEQEQAQELADLQAELLEFQLLHDDEELEDEDFASKEAQLLEKLGVLVGAGEAGEKG